MAKNTMSYMILLAIPGMLSVLLNNIYRLIDQLYVQDLGAAPQAALGASTFILIGGFGFFSIISAGVAPLVARFTGAEDDAQCRQVISKALKLSTLISVIFCAILVFFPAQIADSVGLSGESSKELETYLFWIGITGFGFSYGPLIDAIWIARGNTVLPLMLQFTSSILNLIFNDILILRLEYGIAGAAIASGISRLAVVAIGLWLMYKEFRPTWGEKFQSIRIIRIGLPASMGILLYAGVYWILLYYCISPLGDSVNAALGLGFSILEGVSYPLFAGVMLAVSSVIGRQLGAKEEKSEIKRTLYHGLYLSTTIGLLAGFVFYFYSQSVCSYFTKDPDTLKEAILYGQVLAFSQVFVSWEALSEGVLGGAGDTKSIFWISLPLNLLRIPFSYYFCYELGWGAAGIWWVINVSTYLKVVLKWYVIIRGKWLTLQI